MTEALLSSTVPVFAVDGEVRGELARDILRLKVEESTSGLKTMTLRLIAHGPDNGKLEESQLYLDGSIVDFGKEIKISIGADTEAQTIFIGLVSAIEAEFEEGEEPKVTLFAEDALMKLRMTRRMKTYENMSDSDIANAIASEHGLSAEVDADGPSYDVVQQWNQSDLAFLRERARRIQAEVWVNDQTLHFKSRGNRSATSITLVQGNHLISTKLRADLAHQRTKVKLSGYDANQRERIEEEAGNDAIQAEVAGGLTGPTLLQRTLGERVSYRVRDVPLKSSEAADWVRAEMLRRARSFVTVVGTTRGTANMVVASNLTLERTGHPFEGKDYYVTHVCHTYDLQNGFRTHFEAQRATLQEGS